MDNDWALSSNDDDDDRGNDEDSDEGNECPVVCDNSMILVPS